MKNWTAVANGTRHLDVVDASGGSSGGTIELGAGYDAEIIGVTGGGPNVVAVTYRDASGSTFVTTMKLPLGQRMNTRKLDRAMSRSEMKRSSQPTPARVQTVRHYEGNSGVPLLFLLIVLWVAYKCIEAGLVHASVWSSYAWHYWIKLLH